MPVEEMTRLAESTRVVDGRGCCLSFSKNLGSKMMISSRFFILKSVGKGVIRSSLTQGTYSVQPVVGVRLNRAFIKSRGNIFLIFSTKKSKAFQALGKMKGLACLEPNGRFRFWVEWLTDYVHLPFSDVEPIKQRSDSQFSVTASQDGQEIGIWAGRQIASLLVIAPPPHQHVPSQDSDEEPKESVKEKKGPQEEQQRNHIDGDLLRPPAQLERFKEYPATVQPQIGANSPLVWNQLQFSVDLNKSLGDSFVEILTPS